MMSSIPTSRRRQKLQKKASSPRAPADVSIKELKRRKRAIRRLKAQKAFKRHLKSSFITEMQYFEEERKVWVKLSGKKYTIRNVMEHVFVGWYKGQASCTTDDARKVKRWWIDKTPSLGAFWNQVFYDAKRGHPRFPYIVERGWF